MNKQSNSTSVSTINTAPATACPIWVDWVDRCPSWSGRLVLVLAASWLIAISAWIHVPLWPVPVTMQPWAVLVVGGLLGPKWGVAAVLAYLFQGSAGLPVFAGASAGFWHLFGPTGGYLIGYLPAAYIAGYAHQHSSRLVLLVLGLFAALLALYIPGLVWLAQYKGWPLAISTGLVPFLIGDVFKVGLATCTLVAARSWIATPQKESMR